MAVGEASDFNNFYSICGLLGGIVFPLSTVPQVIKTYRTKSAKDLSYVWQALFVVGFALVAIYGLAYTLWPVLIPMIADVFLMSSLIIMKIRYDGFRSRATKTPPNGPIGPSAAAAAAEEKDKEEHSKPEDEVKLEFVENIQKNKKTTDGRGAMAASEEGQAMQKSPV